MFLFGVWNNIPLLVRLQRHNGTSGGLGYSKVELDWLYNTLQRCGSVTALSSCMMWMVWMNYLPRISRLAFRSRSARVSNVRVHKVPVPVGKKRPKRLQLLADDCWPSRTKTDVTAKYMIHFQPRLWLDSCPPASHGQNRSAAVL